MPLSNMSSYGHHFVLQFTKMT